MRALNALVLAAILGAPQLAVAGPFVSNANGTVTDLGTNLVWEAASASPVSWSAALATCDAKDFAGSTAWRLPSLKEAYTLIHFATRPNGFDPAVDTVAFPTITAGNQNMWTSTPDVNTSHQPFLLSYTPGVSPQDPTSSFSYRCVRTGP